MNTQSSAPNRRFNALSESSIGLLLLALLVITRSGLLRSHFGDHLSLPDASWAMFWLAGALTTSLAWPVVLMLACAAVDWWVIAHGVSADCFTPAYPFLVPAYGSLWWLGRLMQRVQQRWWPMAAASLLVGVSACFVISNLGFYLAGGYLNKMSAMDFAAAVARYWAPYLRTSVIYAGALLLMMVGLGKIARLASHTSHTR